MQENFKELLAAMLKELDNGKSVEEIVASKMQEAGLSVESQAAVNDTMASVDKLNAALDSLRKAKAKGASPQEWLSDRVEVLKERLPEEQYEMADEVLDVIVKKSVENLTDGGLGNE